MIINLTIKNNNYLNNTPSDYLRIKNKKAHVNKMKMIFVYWILDDECSEFYTMERGKLYDRPCCILTIYPAADKG